MKGVEITSADPIVLRTNFPEVEALFAAAPKVVGFHIRDMVGRWFGSHYRTWRQGLTRGQRKLADRGAYQYRTNPANGVRSQAALRKAIGTAAGLSLDSIWGRGVIRSDVVFAHERGATMRPTRSRFLRIPVGPWARGKTKKELRTLWPAMLADAFVRRGRRGLVIVRPFGKTKTGKDRLQTIALLRRQVTLPATLRVQATWDAQASERLVRQQETMDRIVAELTAMTQGVTDAQ